MSLVDSDHLRPATRGRHGAHYWAKADGDRLIPCGTFYPNELEKKTCSCGKENYLMSKREMRVFNISDEENNTCISCGKSLMEVDVNVIDVSVKKKTVPEGVKQ